MGAAQATVGERTVSLTPIEVAFLSELAHNQGRPVSKAMLLRRVWGYAEGVQTRAVHHAVTRLRQKVGRDGIQTVRGIGYVLGSIEVVERESPASLPRDSCGTQGRRADIRVVGRLLDEHGLALVCGPPGVGKSHLARCVARESDGSVLWCSLEDVERDALAARVRETLGLAHTADDGAVRSALKLRRSTLVVIDGIDAADIDRVEAWFDAGQGARCLITVDGVVADPRAFRVEPLPPGPAEALFLAHAPRGTSAEHVPELVEALGGLPAALVIAARQVRTLPPGTLLEVLRKGKNTARCVDAIDAAVRAAWEQLPEPGRAAARAASAFQGSFAMEDLDQVAGTDCLAGLEHLIDLGLVRRREADGRFALTPGARRCSSSALDEAADRPRIQAAHTSWVLAQSGRAAQQARDDRAAQGIAALGRLMGDITALVRRRDPRAALALAHADPWMASQLPPSEHLARWHGVSIEALEPDDQLEAHRSLGNARFRAGEFESAEASAQAMEDIRRTAGGAALRAAIAMARGRLDQAQSVLVQTPEPATRRDAFLFAQLRGTLNHYAGSPELAQQHYAEALRCARQLGDPRLEGIALGWLGTVALNLRDPGAALKWFHMAIPLHEASGTSDGLSSALGNAGTCLMVLERYPEARHALSRSSAIAAEAGASDLVAVAQCGLAALALLEGEMCAALERLDVIRCPPGRPTLDAEIRAFRVLALHGSGLRVAAASAASALADDVSEVDVPELAELVAIVRAATEGRATSSTHDLRSTPTLTIARRIVRQGPSDADREHPPTPVR